MFQSANGVHFGAKLDLAQVQYNTISAHNNALPYGLSLMFTVEKYSHESNKK